MFGIDAHLFCQENAYSFSFNSVVDNLIQISKNSVKYNINQKFGVAQNKKMKYFCTNLDNKQTLTPKGKFLILVLQ